MNILELVKLAHAGAEWEHGHASGVAPEHATLMEMHRRELANLLTMLRKADAAKLPIQALLKIRRRRAKAEVAP